MLTINIPVYNIEVYDLVSELSRQASEPGMDYEIRVYDDASDERIKKRNERINAFANTVYVTLAKNSGRAAIRNKMAKESKYEYLLFIDADSELASDRFLIKYLNAIKKNVVLCGGTSYKTEKPEPDKMLRWVYGKKREAVPAIYRNEKKGFIITSNNFLIEKEVFESVGFREEIKKYGHEDTLFGFDLYKKNYNIQHIDNPVYHIGLENSADFIRKTREGLQSLQFITEKLLVNNNKFEHQVNFLKVYKKVRRYIPKALLKVFYRIFHEILEKNLQGKHPSLKAFDIYKILYFAHIKNRT